MKSKLIIFIPLIILLTYVLSTIIKENSGINFIVYDNTGIMIGKYSGDDVECFAYKEQNNDLGLLIKFRKIKNSPICDGLLCGTVIIKKGNKQIIELQIINILSSIEIHYPHIIAYNNDGLFKNDMIWIHFTPNIEKLIQENQTREDDYLFYSIDDYSRTYLDSCVLEGKKLIEFCELEFIKCDFNQLTTKYKKLK